MGNRSIHSEGSPRSDNRCTSESRQEDAAPGMKSEQTAGGTLDFMLGDDDDDF